MLAFVIPLDDVVITNLIAGPGQETLPIFMLAALRRTVTPEINAVSTALLAVSVLMVSLSFLLSREKNDRHAPAYRRPRLLSHYP